jgi:hypothetical protein
MPEAVPSSRACVSVTALRFSPVVNWPSTCGQLAKYHTHCQPACQPPHAHNSHPLATICTTTPSPHAHTPKPTPAPSLRPAEGRLHPTTGNLQCSYHGWQFSGSGACTDIPQAPDAKAHDVARASKRSCARAFPTTSRHGLLWVWLESGPQAEQDSEQAPVLAVPEMEGEGGIYYPFAKW